MPKVIFTHAVKDVDHWVARHAERAALFADWGSNLVDHVSADSGNTVALSIDVHDMDAMKSALAGADMAAAKQAHGVLEPVAMFVEAE
jgi:hypothetical protein